MDNPERREREQQHSTEAHQRIRRNSDRRNEEQIHNTEAHRHVRLQNPEQRRAEQERDTIGKSIYFNILINNDAIAHRMAREDPVQRLEEHQRDLLHRREARSDPQYQAREQHINSARRQHAHSSRHSSLRALNYQPHNFHNTTGISAMSLLCSNCGAQ